MSQPERRHFSGQEKVKILRLHLLEGKQVSELCDQHKINPSLFYQWQRTFFENGARAFEGAGKARSDAKLEKQGSRSRRWNRSSNASTRCSRSCWRSISA